MNKDQSIKKIRMMIVVGIFLLAFFFHPTTFFAQENKSEEASDIEDISLAELLDVKIELSSKKEESLFDSPLSASVLTRQEIIDSGVTSIMEAFRLIPGVIVREQTPGNYDIHLRGFDNIPGKLPLPLAANSLTLVMIDNRIIYNYFNGGTYWEGMPIDVNDVERIEVVRGAASAMYGPNAVTGVINIVTRRQKEEGIFSMVNAQGGSYSSLITNGSLGFKKDKLSLLVSGNYTNRERMQNTYYDFTSQSYVDYEVFQLPDGEGLFGEDSLAVRKHGFNGYLDYDFSESTNVKLSGGVQDSQARRAYIDLLISPLIMHDHETAYVNAEFNSSGLTAKFSYHDGDMSTEGTTYVNQDFKMKTTYASIEYKFEGENFSIRPGVAYSNATYDGVFFNGEVTTKTTAFSFLGEWYPQKKVRVVAGIRGDKYNTKDNLIFSYQLASTLKLNENNVLRAVYSRAHQAPFMLYNYINFGTKESGRISLGNFDVDPLIVDMFEVGYRGKLSRQFQVDLELSYGVIKDYIEFKPTLTTEDNLTYFLSTSVNMPTEAKQINLTFSLNYIPSTHLSARIFGTLQKTKIYNYIEDVFFWDVTKDITHEYTPDFYGGLVINYKPVKKMNINANGYYYSDHIFNGRTITGAGGAILSDGNEPIDAKFIFNLKVSYEIFDGLSLFVTARNLFNSDSIEFAYADQIKGIFMAGFNYEFQGKGQKI